jgi:hypothetical protein
MARPDIQLNFENIHLFKYITSDNPDSYSEAENRAHQSPDRKSHANGVSHAGCSHRSILDSSRRSFRARLGRLLFRSEVSLLDHNAFGLAGTNDGNKAGILCVFTARLKAFGRRRPAGAELAPGRAAQSTRKRHPARSRPCCRRSWQGCRFVSANYHPIRPRR